MTRDSDSVVAFREAVGAPETKVEITPEMIKAGAEILLRDESWAEFMSPTVAEIVAEDVLLAALSA